MAWGLLGLLQAVPIPYVSRSSSRDSRAQIQARRVGNRIVRVLHFPSSTTHTKTPFKPLGPKTVNPTKAFIEPYSSYDSPGVWSEFWAVSFEIHGFYWPEVLPEGQLGAIIRDCNDALEVMEGPQQVEHGVLVGHYCIVVLGLQGNTVTQYRLLYSAQATFSVACIGVSPAYCCKTQN